VRSLLLARLPKEWLGEVGAEIEQIMMAAYTLSSTTPGEATLPWIRTRSLFPIRRPAAIASIPVPKQSCEPKKKMVNIWKERRVFLTDCLDVMDVELLLHELNKSLD